jgi:hypothetical protein
MTGLEGLVSGVRAVVNAQRRLAGVSSASEVGEAYVRFLRAELLPYGRTIADLTVDYYRTLAEAARDYGERFYDEVLGDDGFEEVVSTGPRVGRPAIVLLGPAGSEITTGFTLENHDPTPARVTLEAGLCRGPDGRTFTAPLSIEPVSLLISPDETAAVRVRVRLLPEIFTPGVTYNLPLQVHGPRPATMDVTIRAALVNPELTDRDQKQQPGSYVVECPGCGRSFTRKTDDLKLRPHKNADGADCPRRKGRRPAS